jgi:small subunit ribosomal protein S1
LTSDPQDHPAGGESHGDDEATDMEALLNQSVEIKMPHRGDIVEGVMMGWDRDGALVDIGSKTEGVVHRQEMHSLGADVESKLQPGDKVLVFIVHPETAEGQILLSIDRARGEQGWRTLQDRFEAAESFEGDVTGYNRGGLLVNVEGVNAFVPLSQVVGVRPDRDRQDGGSNLADNVGRTLRLKVIEINRRRNRVILSERAALQEWRMEQKERLIQELREGDIRRGKISSVRNFGIFVDLGGADGLAHLSELSWERNKSPSELFKVGDEVDVYVTKIDAENKKIALSLRRANPALWEEAVDKYREGQVVPGRITKLVTFGAFARVEGPVEGLIHVSELVDQRIGHPKEVVREGDLLPLKIVRIERDRHRLGLSLRQARREGEMLGFVFSDGGEVISVPEGIRAEFEEREGPAEHVAPAEPRPAAEAPAEKPAAEGEPVAEVAEEAPEAEAEPAAEAAEEAPEAEAEPAAETAEEAPEGEAEPAAEAAEEAPEAEAEPAAEAAEEAPEAEAEPPAEAAEEASEAEAEPPAEESKTEATPEEGTTTEEPSGQENPASEPQEPETATSDGGEEEDPTAT